MSPEGLSVSPIKVSQHLASLAPPLVTPTRLSISLLDRSTMSPSAPGLLHFLPREDGRKFPIKTFQRRNVMSLSFIVNHDDESPLTEDEEASDSGSDSTESESITAEPHHAFIPGSTLCSKRNCYRAAQAIFTGFGAFCEFHKPSRLCKVPECQKCAKTGGYCISHGGGRRCHIDGCIKSAKEGGYCIAHGGGKRCKLDNCSKSALSGGLCSAHGGGKRCSVDDCSKTALKGGRCIAHGGGRRCEVEGCSKSAVGGHLCVSHGGGRRCREDGCNKGAVRKGLCIRHGARR